MAGLDETRPDFSMRCCIERVALAVGRVALHGALHRRRGQGGVLVLLLLSFAADIFRDKREAQEAPAEPAAFDPMAGGFPVPPLPGQELPPVPRRRPRRERELIVSGGSDTASDGSIAGSRDGKEGSDG